MTDGRCSPVNTSRGAFELAAGGWSLAQIALAAGVGRTAAHSWRSGKSLPDVARRQRLQCVLGLPAVWWVQSVPPTEGHRLAEALADANWCDYLPLPSAEDIAEFESENDVPAASWELAPGAGDVNIHAMPDGRPNFNKAYVVP